MMLSHIVGQVFVIFCKQHYFWPKIRIIIGFSTEKKEKHVFDTDIDAVISI